MYLSVFEIPMRFAISILSLSLFFIFSAIIVPTSPNISLTELPDVPTHSPSRDTEQRRSTNQRVALMSWWPIRGSHWGLERPMTEWHSCPDDQSQGRADVDENIDQSQCGTRLFMNLNFYAPWMSPMIFPTWKVDERKSTTHRIALTSWYFS